MLWEIIYYCIPANPQFISPHIILAANILRAARSLRRRKLKKRLNDSFLIIIQGKNQLIALAAGAKPKDSLPLSNLSPLNFG